METKYIDYRKQKVSNYDISSTINNLNSAKNSDIIELIFLDLDIELNLFIAANYENKTNILLNYVDSVSSLVNFMNNEFVLSGMKFHEKFNNKLFKDLPVYIQDKIFCHKFFINTITNYSIKNDNNSLDRISELINNLK